MYTIYTIYKLYIFYILYILYIFNIYILYILYESIYIGAYRYYVDPYIFYTLWLSGTGRCIVYGYIIYIPIHFCMLHGEYIVFTISIVGIYGVLAW